MRVIIADDHPLILMGVKMLIEGLPGMEVVAEADSADGLLAALRDMPCDLLITDFSMPGGQAEDGLRLLMRIRRSWPELPIIVLTMMANAGVLSTILEAGVRGLVDKSSGVAEIATAIQAVRLSRGKGCDYLSESFRLKGLSSDSQRRTVGEQSLSPRELEVIRLFCSGLTVTDIAERLARSVKTISRQKASAMAKLGLKGDLDIFVYGREHGLDS